MGYETLTSEECHEVVDFIEANAEDRTISLRLLEPSYRKLIYARSEGLDWRPLVLTQPTHRRKEDVSRRIDAKAQEIRMLHQAVEQFPVRSVTNRHFGARPLARAGLHSSVCSPSTTSVDTED